MKQLEINIPNDLSEITLGKYERLQSVIKDETVDYNIALNTVSILCDISIEDCRGMNKQDFEDITSMLNKVLQKDCKWRQRFFIGKTEYGFIPNLDDMSFGEYVDLDTYIKDPSDMDKIMSILYRPITYDSFGNYQIEKYTGNEDRSIMKLAPMDVVNGSMVFFYDLGKELLNHIPDYLQNQLEKTTPSNQTLEINGVGIHQFIHSLKDNLETLMKLLPKKFTHV